MASVSVSNRWPSPEPSLPLIMAQRTWSRRSAPRHDQRICCDLFMRRLTRTLAGAFGQRGADAQTGAMAFGIVDQPSALVGQIAVDRVQGSPQSAGRRALRCAAFLAVERRHDCANALKGELGISCLAVPNPPVQTVDFVEDQRPGLLLLQGAPST